MELFLFMVIFAALTIGVLLLSNRTKELQQRMEALALDCDQIPRLTKRVHLLEEHVLKQAMQSSMVEAVADVEPLVEAAPEPEDLIAPVPPSLAQTGPPPLPFEPEPPLLDLAYADPVVPPEPPAPSSAERLREKMSGTEWEAILGGNWLNKLGVFILVIGVALLLGYSFTQFGPAGRVAIALAVSFTMLAAGVLLERGERYRVFARGMLGGGWAALYFTTYGMQAVNSAKVIHNPLLGGALLLAVALGMIGHSLRYHSQTVTGLAYFVAFGTLAITSVTPLSVIALVPLAASLLYVAYRFEWSQMALFGLIATYGVCASRGDSGAPLWTAQTIFSVYWLLFEGFDLLRAARRGNREAERAIAPLNALAFVALSFAKWSTAAPHHLHVLAIAIAAAYLTSAVIRVKLRPPSSFASESTLLQRIFAGGYQGALTLTAILSAAAVLLKFDGAWATAGLLAEAEILFLAGLVFRESYPRYLAASLFAVTMGKLIALDIPAGGKWVVAGRSLQAWSSSAATAAVLYYLNRALRKADKFYGYAAAGAVALIIGFESPERHLGLNWLMFAAAVFGFGWVRRLEDFRYQGYAVAALGVAGVTMHQLNIAWGYSAPMRHPWIALASASLLAYAAVVCALRSGPDRFGGAERGALELVASWATVAALMGLVWRVAPAQYVGVGWMALALLVLELGILRAPEHFRKLSYLVAASGVVWVFFSNVVPVHNDGPLGQRLTAAFAALLAYAFAARVHGGRLAAVPEQEARAATDLASSIGTLFALTSLWALLPPAAVAPAWGVVALVLLELGFSLNIPSLRMQAHAAGAAAFGRLFFANFAGAGYTAGISHRLLTVVPVAVAQYYVWHRQRAESGRLAEWERKLVRCYLYSGAILIAVLLRFELGRSMVAAGWALLALVLIALGQRMNNADLRRQSYALAALAFLRSWTTDFYDPSSLAGAPTRIAIGAVVIACFFAAQLLLPRSRPRLFYSLLSTALLAIVLFHEVSGSMLTVAWGLQGVAILIAGFPLLDRTLRLSGLALFLVCILKLFFYDLRQLETMPRIISFIVLGLILVGVSWVYTRFRDRVQRYL